MIIVTAAIVEKDERVLAARRCKDKHLASYWEFPSGRLESGESPEDCLARELREEFEVEASVGSFFAESIHDYSGKVVQLPAFQVTIDKDELKLLDHDKVLWLFPKELDSVNWAPADFQLVKSYQSVFVKKSAKG